MSGYEDLVPSQGKYDDLIPNQSPVQSPVTPPNQSPVTPPNGTLNTPYNFTLKQFDVPTLKKAWSDAGNDPNLVPDEIWTKISNRYKSYQDPDLIQKVQSSGVGQFLRGIDDVIPHDIPTHVDPVKYPQFAAAEKAQDFFSKNLVAHQIENGKNVTEDGEYVPKWPTYAGNAVGLVAQPGTVGKIFETPTVIKGVGLGPGAAESVTANNLKNAPTAANPQVGNYNPSGIYPTIGKTADVINNFTEKYPVLKYGLSLAFGAKGYNLLTNFLDHFSSNK